MAELHVDEVQGGGFSTDNFKNVRDAITGIWYRIWGAFPSVVNIIRMIHSITRATASAGGGRIYKDSTDTDAKFSVSDLKFYYRGELVTVAGATGNSLSHGDVAHHVYATPAGAIAANNAYWPSTPHVRLGIVTLSSGAWNWNNFVDHRNAGALRVYDEPNGGHLEVEWKTSDDTLTASDSQTLFTNPNATGTVNLTLPSALAAGMSIEAVVMAAQNLKITAPSGVTIRVAGSVSATGGYIQSNTVGNAVRLVAVNATLWVATSYIGTWTVT